MCDTRQELYGENYKNIIKEKQRERNQKLLFSLVKTRISLEEAIGQ